jgi:hypothetical protein
MEWQLQRLKKCNKPTINAFQVDPLRSMNVFRRAKVNNASDREWEQ